MHRKLTLLTKGPRSGLDYIQVPTKTWYYSPKTHELFRYTLGVFECYRPTAPNTHNYPRAHTLKVIEDDAVEAKVDDSDGSGPHLVEHYPEKRTTWVRTTEKEAIEKHLSKRNKRHLQQMTKEGSTPSR